MRRLNSLECGGLAPLWPSASYSDFCYFEYLATTRRQAAAGQSGAGPPHSKELD